jgi:simple sugar transport system permease protein
MTAIADPNEHVVVTRATPEQKRATVIGIVLILLGALTFWIFGLGVQSGLESTFNLSLPGARYGDLSWTVDSRTVAFAVALVLAFLGGMTLRRSHLKWTNLSLSIGLGLVAFAFLTWAAADGSFSLVGMLTSTVVLSVPVTLGALTGPMCERVAVINIAIEGQLLTAAFVGTIVGSAANIWAGLVAAMLTGALLGLVLAVLAIKYRIDQIIAGVVINIFALGLTSFLARRVLSEAQDLNAPGRFGAMKIPFLGDIPIIGPMFFDHNMFVYVTFILVVALHLLRFCVDVGHAACFSRVSPEEWIPVFKDYLICCNFHDNQGLEDEHLACGRGYVPFDVVLEELKQTDAEVLITLDVAPEDIPASVDHLVNCGFEFEKGALPDEQFIPVYDS